MHHSFLFAIIALFDSHLQLTKKTTIPQHRTTQRQTPRGFATISFPSSFLHSFTKTIQKAKNFFSFCCAIPKKKAEHQTTKHGPPRAKSPPTTDKAERLTLARESRPTLPTASAALSLLLLTRPHTTGGRFFCYGLLALQNQPHTPLVGRTAAPPLPPEI